MKLKQKNREKSMKPLQKNIKEILQKAAIYIEKGRTLEKE